MGGRFLVALLLALSAVASTGSHNVHMLGALLPEEEEVIRIQIAETEQEFRIAELQAEVERLSNAIAEKDDSLEECLADNVAQPLAWRTAGGLGDGEPTERSVERRRVPDTTGAPHGRRADATEPSAVPTAVPTTLSPSASPSVSPVPTTTGVTTYAQLAAHANDEANDKVIIEADLYFPAQAPITVESGRSLSIVGRSAIDGGRVTLDGQGQSRQFLVIGGTLELSFLILVNGERDLESRIEDPRFH
jgi:hypothetical protein